MPATAPPRQLPASRVTPWDRAAVTALGLAGFLLSYDALRQTADAIHVRGLLTYVFPLIIDGFIAYGVRALLVLRGAAFGARAYIWTLFAAATAASVWANVLHAVRLNDQAPTGGGLRLGDATVGALSMIAPLALAGAVHLLILITRHTPTQPSPHVAPGSGDRSSPSPPGASAQTAEPAPQITTLSNAPAPLTARTPHPDQGLDEPSAETATDQETGALPVTAVRAKPTGRPPGATMDQLLACARPAAAEHGLTRAVVEQAVRAAGHPLGSARFTQLMDHLRAEVEAHTDTAEPRPGSD